MHQNKLLIFFFETKETLYYINYGFVVNQFMECVVPLEELLMTAVPIE